MQYRSVPRIERGGVRVTIGSAVRRLGYAYDVWYAHARAIRGGVWSYGAPLLGTPLQ